MMGITFAELLIIFLIPVILIGIGIGIKFVISQEMKRKSQSINPAGSRPANPAEPSSPHPADQQQENEAHRS